MLDLPDSTTISEMAQPWSPSQDLILRWPEFAMQVTFHHPMSRENAQIIRGMNEDADGSFAIGAEDPDGGRH